MAINYYEDGDWQDNPNQQLDEQIAANKGKVRRQAAIDATFIGQGVKAASNFIQRQFDEQPERYAPLDDLPSGYEMDAGAFVDAKSPAEVNRIKSQIDSSRMLRRYQETHPVESMALNFVPAAAEFAVGGYVTGGFKAAARVDASIKAIPSALVRVPVYAGVGGLANGAQQVAFENLASLNDPLSTKEEQLANIKFATGLGALLPFIGHGSVAGYKSMVRKFGQEAVDAEVRLVTDIAQKEAMPYQPIKQQAAFMPDDFSPDFPLAKTEEINLRFKESSVDAVVPNISPVYEGLARSIDEGSVSARLDISDDIARASEVVTGKKDIAAQPDEVRGTARLFFEDDAMTKRAADDVIEQRLAAYVEKAKSVVDDVGLSVGDAVTASRVLNEVLRDIGSDIRVTEKRLSFEDELLDAVQTLTRRDYTRARALMAGADEGDKKTLGGNNIITVYHGTNVKDVEITSLAKLKKDNPNTEVQGANSLTPNVIFTAENKDFASAYARTRVRNFGGNESVYEFGVNKDRILDLAPTPSKTGGDFSEDTIDLLKKIKKEVEAIKGEESANAQFLSQLSNIIKESRVPFRFYNAMDKIGTRALQVLKNNGIDGIRFADEFPETGISNDLSTTIAIIPKNIKSAAAAAVDALEKKQTLGSGGTGVGAQSARDIDTSIPKIEKLRILAKANLVSSSGIASAATSPSIGLSLFGTPQSKIFGAKLIDMPFRFNDPISVRNGHVPANADRTYRIERNNTLINEVDQETAAEFAKEAEKAGIKENLGQVLAMERSLGLIKEVPDSQFSSVNKFVSSYRKNVLNPILDAAKKVGIAKDEAVLGAEKYLTRYWDRDKIKADFEGAVEYFYNGFKKQINNPNNPHRDRIDAMLEEYASRAAKIGREQGLSQEQISELLKDDFDNWLKAEARETVNNILGLGSKNSEGKYLNESVFVQMGKDRTVFLMDEDLYRDGFLIADPVGAISKNARRLVSEIEIYKRFNTLDFEEAWMPAKAEIDAMRARKDPETPSIDEEMTLKAHAREAWDINLENYTFMQNPAKSSNSYTNQINQYTAAALKVATPFIDAKTLGLAIIRNDFDLLFNSGRGNMVKHYQGLFGANRLKTADLDKMSKREKRMMGLATSVVNRALAFQDPEIAVKKGVPLGKAQQVSQEFGQKYKTFVDLTYWFNDAVDNITAKAVENRVHELAEDLLAGKTISAEDIGYLRDMMVSMDDLRGFGEQLQKHAIDGGDNYKISNNEAWDNQELADKYRSRIHYARYRNKQGLLEDLPPIIAKTAAGTVFGRFINASISQYQRGILPYIQQGNAHYVGAVGAVGSIAVLNGLIMDSIDGKETTVEDSAKRFIFNGASSFASDAVNKFLWSMGDPEYGQAAGDFSVGRGLSGVYVDTADQIGNAVKGGASMIMGDRPTSVEIKSMTDLMPARKVLPYRIFFNYLEDGVRTEYNYADKWGDPLEARTEEEQAQFRKQAKVKAAKETKAKKKREKSE